MDYYQKIGECTEQEPKKVLREFLTTLKKLYLAYLNKEIDDLTVSDLTVLWYVKSELFSDSIIKLEPKVKDLSAGMDFTSPGITEERKKLIAKELIKRIDEILTK